MDWQYTVISMAVVAIVTVWANIAGRRPRKLGHVPIVPPDIVQLLGLIALFILGAHLISLWRGAPLNPPPRF